MPTQNHLKNNNKIIIILKKHQTKDKIKNIAEISQQHSTRHKTRFADKYDF